MERAVQHWDCQVVRESWVGGRGQCECPLGRESGLTPAESLSSWRLESSAISWTGLVF